MNPFSRSIVFHKFHRPFWTTFTHNLARSRLKAQATATMGLPAVSSSRASFRVDRIGGHATEFLELRAEKPTFHVLFIPGNPGVVAYYKEFLEALFDHLNCQASRSATLHM